MFLRLLLFCVLLLRVKDGRTQLCTGPAADPVKVIDFGTRSNPYPFLGKMGADYGSTTETCTPEGTAALRNAAFMCKPDWVVMPFDHTVGDQEGLFLMVSALPGDSEIMRDTIQGLCPGTVFNFEIWLTNLLVPLACGGLGKAPDIQVQVFDDGGIKLAELTTGPLLATERPEWRAHRLQFRSPGSGRIIFRILSLDAAVCGSDLAIDDISLSPCRPGIQAALVPSGATSLQVCEDQQRAVQLGASFATFNNPTLQWQYSEGGSNFFDLPGADEAVLVRQPSNSGSFAYRLRVTENGNQACTFTSNTVQVLVHRKPFAQSTSYVYGCYGFPVGFQAAGGNRYEWEGPAGFRSTDAAPRIPRVDFSHAGQYRVKVVNSNGCVAFDSTDLVIYTAPTAVLGQSDTSVCTGNSVQLSAAGAPRYLWQPAEGLSNDTIPNPVASPARTTLYTVRVFNEFTCYDTASVLVQVLPKPTADAGPDQYVLKNRTVQLSGRVSGEGVRLRWSPAALLDDSRVQRPRTRLQQTTIFRLEAEIPNGCGIAADEVKIEVIDRLFIPTAFTPDGDQLNDIWQIVALEDYPNAVVQVFNRWGQQVYQGAGRNYRPWDGKFKGSVVVGGVYIYLLNLGDGSPLQTGTLTVLR